MPAATDDWVVVAVVAIVVDVFVFAASGGRFAADALGKGLGGLPDDRTGMDELRMVAIDGAAAAVESPFSSASGDEASGSFATKDETEPMRDQDVDRASSVAMSASEKGASKSTRLLGFALLLGLTGELAALVWLALERRAARRAALDGERASDLRRIVMAD